MRMLIALLLLILPAITRAADPAVARANARGDAAQPYREGYIGSGDARLHYVEAGQGPMILFVHGFPSFWYHWFPQMEALKARYRVVAIDALGANLSAKPENLGAYRVDRLAAGIDRLARGLNGGATFVLIGHDWGAALAFAFAQARPKRLRAVIGLSAPPYNQFLDLIATNPDQRTRSAYMQRFRALTLADIEARNLAPQIARQAYAGLAAKGALTPEDAALFESAVGDPRAINAGMNWYRANIPDLDRPWRGRRWPRSDAAVAVPALLIWGEADATFVPGFPTRMETQGAQVLRLPGIGHWPALEDPGATSGAIDRFLNNAVLADRRPG
jgi:epoxide hydrolase 4